MSFLAMLWVFLGWGVVDAAAWERRRIRCAPDLDTEAMLWAIRQVESGGDVSAIGAAGERSAYQFMWQTWTVHSDVPFEMASRSPEESARVAWEHLNFICRQLLRRGMPCEPVFIAVAWRWGAWAAMTHVRSDYARRVGNLYEYYVTREDRS